jgi:ATP-binding cassette subfamily C protein
MLGAIEPKNGSVTISGANPLKIFAAREGVVGFVPQNIALIDGSIRENLLLGRKPETFTDQDFRSALDFAGLSEYVAGRNLGLDSPLTRAGSELSGGQRQKLGIARAVLSRPQILLLDEATSSLDSESESIVNEAIANLQGKLTLVVVAHRLTAVQSLDRILLLENGSIAADGSFSELLATNNTFQSFVNLSELQSRK